MEEGNDNAGSEHEYEDVDITCGENNGDGDDGQEGGGEQ